MSPHLRLCVAVFAAFASPLASAQQAPPGGGNPTPPKPGLATLRLDAAVDSLPSLVRPLVVVSSGGISAGAYQAGVNWGVLHLLKSSQTGNWTRRGPGGTVVPLLVPHELVVATGASAGNVNSILGTVEWARPNTGHLPRPDSSLYWQVWTGIGTRELLPEFRDSEDHTDTESALSRAHLESQTFRRVRRAFRDDSLVLNRPVATGITMSARSPMTVEVAPNLQVQSMRVATVYNATLLRATRPDTTRIAFEPFDFGQDPVQSLRRFGTVFHLPLSPIAKRGDSPARACDPGVELSPTAARENEDFIQNAALASAAFPYAWAPLEVRLARRLDPDGFPDPYSTFERDFIDGGVFDNNPVGLALDLYRLIRSRPRPEDLCHDRAPRLDWRQPTIMFTDPDSRRGTGPSGRASATTQAPNRLNDALALAGNFLTTGRQYEVESASRDMDGNELRGLAATDRAFPIMGDQVGAFAAFLARPFRVYDFYVGVYDAYLFAATRLTPQSVDRTQRVDSIRVITELYRASGLETVDPLAHVVFCRLLHAEYGAAAMQACKSRPVFTSDVPTDSLEQWEYVLGLMADVAIASRGEEVWFGTLVQSLQADYRARTIVNSWGEECQQQLWENEPEDGRRDLTRVGREPGLLCDAEPFVVRLLRTPSWTLAGATSEVLNYRLDAETGRSGVLTGAAMAALNIYMASRRPGLVINRSSIPYYTDGVYRGESYNPRLRFRRAAIQYTLPNRVVLSAGPYYIAHTLSLRAGPGRFVAEFAPFRRDLAVGTPGRVWSVSGQFGYDFSLAGGLFEVGARGTHVRPAPYVWPFARSVDAFAEGGGWGGEVRVRALHFLSVGFGVNLATTSWQPRSSDSEADSIRYNRKPYFVVGLEDTGGLLYWATRLIGRARATDPTPPGSVR